MGLIQGDKPAQAVDVLEERAGDGLSDFQRVTIDLPLNNGAGAESIRINHGGIEDAFTIDINRTIRVPDNRDTNMLPPGLGPFPLFKVQDFASKMPDDMAKKGGLFFPMYQREAMWISFRAKIPFAVKIYVGGVNAVSGFPMIENEKTREKRLKMMKLGKQIQDYMVVPGQLWLDGIVSEDAKIRQFVAQPKGTGFSVEAQVTGEENVGGIQIEIIPVKREVPEEFDVRYENEKGQVIKRTVNLAKNNLSSQSTWLDLKGVLRQEFDIAIAHQILSSYPSSAEGHLQINDDAKLGKSYFKRNFTLDLRNSLRTKIADNAPRMMMMERKSLGAMPGGAALLSATPRAKEKKKRSSVKEMGLAAGGSIQQTIEPDNYPSDSWDINASIMLNIQILDSESFMEVTGLPPPPTPVDAKTYADHGYPFFELWGEEKTGVKGDFSEVKSVAQIEAERAKAAGEKYNEEDSVPQRVHVIGKFKSTFRPVDVLKRELGELGMDDGSSQDTSSGSGNMPTGPGNIQKFWDSFRG